MNILIEIGHPAHVHFFKGVIEILKKSGHNVLIATRNKEITDLLLDRLGYEYMHLSSPAKTRVGLIFELLIRWYKIIKLIKNQNIHVVTSISGITTAFPAWLCGIRNVTFTDTEDATFTNRASFPFSTIIATPAFFLKELGRKHFKYFGLQELSYLKNFNVEDVEKVCRGLKLPSRYCIIRLIGYDAVHDWRITKLSYYNLDRLIACLERFGEVFIISQRNILDKYKKYIFPFPKEKIHYILGGSELFVGESPTMAVESSMLGTPAFLLSDRFPKLGYVSRLETEYHLLENFNNFEDLLSRINNIEDINELEQEWSRKAERFKNEVEDVKSVAAGIIEKAGKKCAV